MKIYVEGGGDEKNLRRECRRAFSVLLEKAGFKNKMPCVVASGKRQAAFNAFKTAYAPDKDTFVMLLVDSEDPVVNFDAWAHLRQRDAWKKPAGAADDQAQMMVVCMETWLIADPNAFATYFGRDFKRTKLPSGNLEQRSKADVYGAIAAATANTKPKGKYGKARDSFKLLGLIDPNKLRKSCAWADRFFRAVDEHF